MNIFLKETNQSQSKLCITNSKHRNYLVTLTRISKESYFAKYFEHNKKHTKKVWKPLEPQETLSLRTNINLLHQLYRMKLCSISMLFSITSITFSYKLLMK